MANADIESEVRDVEQMSVICAHLAEDFAQQVMALKEMNLTGPQVIKQVEKSDEMLIFAVYHLQGLTKALREKYYSAE